MLFCLSLTYLIVTFLLLINQDFTAGENLDRDQWTLAARYLPPEDVTAYSTLCCK